MALAIEYIVRTIAARTGLRPESAPVRGACWFNAGDRRIRVAAGTHWVELVRSAPDPMLDHHAMLIESFRMQMAKFALDRVGRRLIRVEIPQVAISVESLVRALEALGRDSGLPPRTRAPSSQTLILDHEMVPPDELQVFVRTLAHEGWGISEHVRENHWRLAYVAADREFRVDLGFDRAWASFQVALRPEEIQLRELSRRHLARFLLRRNDVIYWAKLGIAGTDQVVLTLDVPIEELDLERLRLAAKTLARYAVATSTEVQVLSRLEVDPVLHRLLDGRLRTAGPPDASARPSGATDQRVPLPDIEGRHRG